MIHEMTYPQTMQQNSVVKWKNIHILVTTYFLLIRAHVPRHHWGDAIAIEVYFLNHIPYMILNFQTLLQALAHHGPDLRFDASTSNLGCIGLFIPMKTNLVNLSLVCFDVFFVGYVACQKWYHCYHPQTHHTYVTLDVTFIESKMFFHQLMSHSALQGEKRSKKKNLSTLEEEGITLCPNVIEFPNANDISLYPNSIDRPYANEWSLASSEHLLDPVSRDPLNRKAKTSPIIQQYQRTNPLRISLR